MALGKKNEVTGTTGRVQTGNANNDTREKAVAFVNLDYPTRDGGKKRLTSLALMASDPFHAQLIAALEDPATREVRVQQIVARLLGSVNFTKVGDAAELALDFDAA